MTSNRYGALIWLALCYSAITFQIPNAWSTCVDIGKHHAGVIGGCMNTAASLGGAFSSLIFGFVLEHTGSYDAALALMVPALFIGATLWLRIDATQEISDPFSKTASDG
jgi:fucose permease